MIVGNITAKNKDYNEETYVCNNCGMEITIITDGKIKKEKLNYCSRCVKERPEVLGRKQQVSQ